MHFLSVKQFAKILLSPRERDGYETMLEVLEKIFPVALEAVNDPYFMEAIQKSNYADLKNLAEKNKGRLVFSVDIPAILASISGQINIGDIIVAFIMLDISLKSGLTLIGGIKPIHLFNGLIQVKRSTQMTNLPEEKKSPIDIDGPVIYARIPGWESLVTSEGFKDFRIHANAYIQFFEISVDAKLEMSTKGFELYFHPRLDFPLMLLDSLLHIKVNNEGFSFEMAAQLSLTIAALKLSLLTTKGKFKIVYNATSSENALNINCNLLLNCMNKETSFKIDYSLPKEKCQTLSFLADNLLSLLSGSLTKNPALQDITSLTDDQSDAYLAKVTRDLQSRLFSSETKTSEKIQIRNSKLCLLRCLLRINNGPQILQAFKLINDIEKIESDRVQFLIDSPKYMLRTAIAALEKKPFMAFCYLRFLENNLTNNLSKREIGLIKYYLGIMYGNDDVPMSTKFITRWDKWVDHHYKFSYYRAPTESLKISIQLFIDSFALLSENEEKRYSLVNILPIYQLWKHRKSYYLYQKRGELSQKLTAFLFKEADDLEKKSHRKNIGEVNPTQPEIKDVFLSQALEKISYFFTDDKINSVSSISVKNLKIIFILLIQIVLYLNKSVEVEKNIKVIEALCENEFKENILNSYRDILRMAIYNQKRHSDPSKGISEEKFMGEIIKNIGKYNQNFDPLIGDYYYLFNSPLLYYYYGYHLCDVKPEKGLALRIEDCFLKSVTPVDVIRKTYHHPTGEEGDCLEIKVSNAVYYPAYQQISNLYYKRALHELKSPELHPPKSENCEECMSLSIEYNMKFLKKLFLSGEFIRINVSREEMLISDPLTTVSVITFNQFYESPNSKFNLATFKSGLVTVNILKIAEEIFSLNAKEILDNGLIKVISLQALMLRLEIFRFYLGLLCINFLPAFFEICRFIPKFKISPERLFKVFGIFLNLLHDYKSESSTKDNFPLEIVDLLMNKHVLSLTLKKISNKFFEEKITVAQLSEGLNIDEMVLDLSEEVSFNLKDLKTPLDKLRQGIENEYEKLSNSQKEELYKTRIKTPLFSVPYAKDRNKYLFWEEESQYRKSALDDAKRAVYAK